MMNFLINNSLERSWTVTLLQPTNKIASLNAWTKNKTTNTTTIIISKNVDLDRT